MPEIGPADIWFDPRKILPAAKNALMYPVTHPAQTAEFGLSMAPGSGEAMSAVDAWNASGRAGNALLSGNYGQAAGEYGNVLLGALGAIPGAGVIARGTKRGAAWMDRNLPAGVNRLLDAAMPKDPQNTAFAIPAWHGSPHDFDEFKLDKIGTGEGAQAYGHGLYFAENPRVAASYRDALSPPAFAAPTGVLSPEAERALSDIRQAYGGKLSKSELDAVLRDEIGKYGPDDEAMLDVPHLLELRDASNKGHIQFNDPGRLYHTELDVEPHQLLDWDKPLSQQGEGVQKALSQFGQSPSDYDEAIKVWQASLERNPAGRGESYAKQKIAELEAEKARAGIVTGGEFLKRLAYGSGDKLDHAKAAQKLREAGIPGIKYLDQFSRGPEGGTSNFVIFDDKLIKVLSKD